MIFFPSFQSISVEVASSASCSSFNTKVLVSSVLEKNSFSEKVKTSLKLRESSPPSGTYLTLIKCFKSSSSFSLISGSSKSQFYIHYNQNPAKGVFWALTSANFPFSSSDKNWSASANSSSVSSFSPDTILADYLQ